MFLYKSIPTPSVYLIDFNSAIWDSNAADAKIAANLKDVMGYIVELDKNVALNKQATDYQFVILNNKIDCCCEKQRMQAEFDRCYNQLADSSIISYINSTFIPGQL